MPALVQNHQGSLRQMFSRACIVCFPSNGNEGVRQIPFLLHYDVFDEISKKQVFYEVGYVSSIGQNLKRKKRSIIETFEEGWLSLLLQDF